MRSSARRSGGKLNFSEARREVKEFLATNQSRIRGDPAPARAGSMDAMTEADQNWIWDAGHAAVEAMSKEEALELAFRSRLNAEGR